ncbi:MAG: hypothetical protein ACRYGP_16330 [Janthinobacterium lividum]
MPDDPVTDRDESDCIHPDDRARMAEMRDLDFGQQAPAVPYEFRILCPETRETWWISSRCHFLLGEGGHAIRLVGTFADVTERRHMQDQLRSTLRRHEAFVAATSAEFSTFRLLFDACEERWGEVRERTFFDFHRAGPCVAWAG